MEDSLAQKMKLLNRRTRPLLYAGILALTYFVTGKLAASILGLVKAEASPVWPPAGIALAALLLQGRRMWPGIALGSVLLNLPPVYRPPSLSHQPLASPCKRWLGRLCSLGADFLPNSIDCEMFWVWWRALSSGLLSSALPSATWARAFLVGFSGAIFLGTGGLRGSETGWEF
jgi:hypothetical protein